MVLKVVVLDDHSLNEQRREALFEVLDALGAMSNPNELGGWGISKERAERIIELAKKPK